LATRIPSHHNVGLYWSAFGEVNTAPIISMLWRKRCRVWLPVINPYNHTLYWRNYTPQLAANGRNHRHQLGMQQPHTGRRCRTAQLDTLLLPLLAIDSQGNRLGQGGGYYDRTLAKLPRFARRPHCIGLAYPWQVVGHIPTQWWDIPLDAYCHPQAYHKAGQQPLAVANLYC
jgi:5-formyltetrahydrofolate cyclo-ligase